VAAVTHGKKGRKKIAPECYIGSMTGERFERWFEFNLLNRIKAGRTIIIDRASFHRKNSLRSYA
jgi:transposase